MLSSSNDNVSEPADLPASRLNYTQVVADASDVSRRPLMLPLPLGKVMSEYDADDPST